MSDIYLEAEFTDGFVLVQDDEDKSSFVEGKNIFHDIEQMLHVAEHGPMSRLTLFVVPINERFDIDWTKVPENAVPIREMSLDRQFTLAGEPVGNPILRAIDFGYKFVDQNGEVQREIFRIT